MKFSILIAHYNNAHFFKDCFESILQQTYTDWEAVILDDASSEEEKKTVQEIISKDNLLKIKYYISKRADGKIIEYNA